MENSILSKRRINPEVLNFTSDKIDSKTKAIKRDAEGHFIILKGKIHQEDIHIVNTYAPNIGHPAI